jgi:ATP-dependent exoDNAse (exonuclease V) beta subunit
MIENIISFFGLGHYTWNVAYLHAFQDYVLTFAGDKNGDLPSFLEWCEIDSIKKSVVLPDNQNAIRVLTIHKSKGLEFKVVILPFLSWNLDHKSFYQPILWVEPDKPPFNKLSIIPVKYRKNLSETIFIDFYKEEKYSSYVDNINLLYVALTRAKDVIYGFAPAKPRVENAIASILKEALDSEKNIQDLSGIHLKEFYNSEHGIFEFGEIPENKSEIGDNQYIFSLSYSISTNIDSLKLKLHGENYFAPSSTIMREKINYGKLMHEVFESIITPEDIPGSVRKLVLEGKISVQESAILSEKLNLLLMTPQVTDWFRTGSTVHTEAEILLPSGNIRRPDRIIIQDDITTIVDFKFGEEYQHYVDQVDQYRRLMIEMGYSSIKAFIWYVDKNKILSV